MNDQQKPVRDMTDEEFDAWWQARLAATNPRDRCVDSEWGTLCMTFPDDMTLEEIDAEIKEMEAWRERLPK